MMSDPTGGKAAKAALRAAMLGLRKAADAGHAKAQARLAEILDASDYNEEAFAYYRKSADQGDVDGVFGLASMYAVGEGTKKDPAEAYKTAAEALFADLDAFFGRLKASGRDTVVFFVPEHGAAVKGSHLTVPGMRDLPTPENIGRRGIVGASGAVFSGFTGA